MFPSAIVTFGVLLTSAIFTSAAPAETPLAKRALANVIKKCTVPNTVALTFDDGPSPYVYDVGKKIAEYGGKATFFVNGQNTGCIYTEDNAKRIKWILSKGHMLASHTWSHANLSTLTFDQLHNHLWLVEDALTKIAGVVPAFTRPPYGEYNDLVLQVAGQRGQDLVLWDHDSGDSWGPSETVETIKARYDELAKLHPSNVLTIAHDIIETTAHAVLNYVVPLLAAKGYKFVTVAECLGRQPYAKTVAAGVRDATWTCDNKPLPGQAGKM